LSWLLPPWPALITTGGSSNRPFSPAVKAGGFVYVAGAIGDGSTPLAMGDVRAQTRQTLDGIATTLKAAGASLANTASVTVCLRNAADFAAMNDVYATYFPKNPPARTTVVVTQPLANADGLIEISMIAIPDGGERAVIHPDGWAKVPSPYSLRHQERRHAVPRRPGQPERQGRHERRWRRHGTDQDRPRQRRGHPEGGRHDVRRCGSGAGLLD